MRISCIFFFQAEDGIRDLTVTGVQTCALPIARLGRPVKFDAGALELLATYPWPGNVRELANIIERLAILAPRRGGNEGSDGNDETITADDVAHVVPQDGARARQPEAWTHVSL